MTKKFAKIRSILKNEHKRLLEEMGQLENNTRTQEIRREGSPFGKREEEATESFEFEKRLAVEKQVRERLAEIEHALKKFEDGTYGLCDICGQSINPARLEALPQASVCVDCKGKNPQGRPSPG